MGPLAGRRHHMLLAINRRRRVSSLIGLLRLPVVCCAVCVSLVNRVIDRLSTDVPILMWRCNYRTTTRRSDISTVVTFYIVDVGLHYSYMSVQ